MTENPNHLAIGRKTFWGIVAALCIVVYLGYFAHRKPDACGMQKHYFKEKAFDVGICLVRRTDARVDYMVLRVYDAGLLVAERKFKQYVDSGERMLNALEYKDVEINYTDADPERTVPPTERHLAMPPTTWDWFTANYLPF